MQENKVSLRRNLKTHLKAVRLLGKINPGFFPLATVEAALSALIPYVTVFFSSRILSELALYRREDVLWKWVIAGVLCTGLLAIIKACLSQRFDTLYDDMWGRKESLFAEKLFSMDYTDVDKQETHDKRRQMQQMENWASWGLAGVPEYYSQVLTALFGIISGLALTLELFTSPVPDGTWLTTLNSPLYVLLLAAIMLLIGMASGWLSSKAAAYFSNLGDDATLGNRLFGYYFQLGSKTKRSMDVRMYNQQNISQVYFFRDFAFGAEGIISRRSWRGMGISAALSVGISAFMTGFIYVFTCLKAWGGAFDVGSVTRYVGAATAMAANVISLLKMLGHMKENTLHLESCFEFLEMPNAMYQGSLTTEKRTDRQYEVEFRNVSFKYPGSELWALKDVSLKFKVGKRLAIVGENGSGKTTFIKLLCRLYDPQEGQILLNGIDIRKYNYRDYMAIFSVVFQDFQLLSQPLGANVAGSMDYDADKVTKALCDAGFGERLASLPQGLDTQLYKEFTENGVEISGGEAQKIAIARALYKDGSFIILDEPTAALDPLAEAEIYSRFNDISGDKTAIYISHRLSSCKFCDEIAVFHKGSLIQQGSHEALLSDENGKYYELWHAQAQYYA